MASRAQVAPNYYELLRLSPTANQKEIAGAFARAMSTFSVRSVAVAMDIIKAFEVLRNPAKREAYDRSMGLAPAAQLHSWQYKLPARLEVPSTPVRPGSREHFVAPPGKQEPLVLPEALPSAAADAEVAHEKISALILSLRKLAEPAAPAPEALQPEKPPEPVGIRELEPERTTDPLDPVIEDILAFGRAEKASLQRAEFRLPNWRRPAMALGGLVAGASILGIAAGLSVADAQGADPQVAAPLPAAKPHSTAATESADPVAEPVSQQTASSVRAAPIFQTKRTVPTKEVAAISNQGGPETQEALNPESGRPDASATDPLAPMPVSAEPVSARMPLPGHVVARTIGRIGYRCGEVATTTAIEGSPGAFRVTCTSGDAYRATLVRGRYHFRRMIQR